jgi:hypothetical protein
MSEPKKIDGALAIFEQSLQRSLRAIFREIAKKRIASTEREEPERDAILRARLREDSVDDFVRRTVATDGDEMPVTLFVRFARQVRAVAGTGGGNDVDVETVFAQAGNCRASKLGGAATPGCGIYYGEKCFSHAAEGLPVLGNLKSARESTRLLQGLADACC